jgi:hypothetical protein
MTSGNDLTRGLAETAREKRKEVAMVWKCILRDGAEDEAVKAGVKCAANAGGEES